MAKALIRALSDSNKTLGYAYADFRDGVFTVSGERNVEIFLAREDADRASRVIVESTDELMWGIRSATLTSPSRVQVVCQPWLEGLRKSILADDYLIETALKGFVA